MADKKKKSSIFSEFKTFALRGNVIDLAVGVIVGGAFSKITTSLVNDVLMPFIGMFLGGVDFSALSIQLPALFAGKEPGVVNLGTFINTVIEFIILAFVVFMIVRMINKLREAEEKRRKAKEDHHHPERANPYLFPFQAVFLRSKC